MSGAALFRRVLIANRGEIACRIIRTLDRLGIESVAVYSEADAGAAHVRAATRAIAIGPAPVASSYLNVEALLRAVREARADAVHPGYGLLSENAAFAAACEAEGVAFVGPTPQQLRDFGLKHRARELAEAAGVPVSQGTGLVADAAAAQRAAALLGYPVLLKAAAGGGGIGMHLCTGADDLAAAFERVRRLAASHFGCPDVFLEKFVARARHVEVQIFGDGGGRVVHLGERDCSLQRRRQKVFEETPAADLDRDLAEAMCTAACRLGESVRYRSAGTVEFLVDSERGTYSFLEVNTRLQVEHGVTEAVTGVDLVEWMLRVAAGDPSPIADYTHAPTGAAVQVRIYAEDPGHDFRPCAGVLSQVALPESVRVDTWIESGAEVSPFYDPLLAKVIAVGPDRAAALQRLAAALAETRIDGVQTNLAYAREIVGWDEFVAARHHTRSLDTYTHRPCRIDVVAPGCLTTVQDLPGRLGMWHVGVPPSGPMDPLAFELANRIVGNRPEAPGLEITVDGPALCFRDARVVCIAGASAAVTLDGAPVPLWEPLTVPANGELRIGAIAGPGARTYLAVRGGLDVGAVLGSRATFTLGGFGGHAGRPLAAGDTITLPQAGDRRWIIEGPIEPEAARRLAIAYGSEWVLHVVPGPHAQPEFFTAADIEEFYAQPFEVHFQSARTGVRLIGPKPRWARTDGGDAGLHPSNIHDTAYAVGSIDYTGDMPVILGPDGPSLGGFVCPAVVTRSDLWKLGQLRPGDSVRFAPVDVATAQESARQQQRALASRAPVVAGRLPIASSAVVAESGVLFRRAEDANRPSLALRLSGDRHLLIEVGPMALDIEVRVRVQLLHDAIEAERRSGRLDGIIDLTPGVRSLQIHYDPDVLPLRRLRDRILDAEYDLASVDSVSLPTRIVHLPLSWQDPGALEAQRKYMEVVRPDAPWSPSNVEFIRRINGLDSEADVRRIVYDASYLVLGLGDVYLGAPVATPLDPRHRLVTTKYNPARTWTPENAVGIGGAYLCIYGMEGPGGYQLVGRTIPVWSTYERWAGRAAGRPWLLRFFDQIRFFPCEAAELLELRHDVRCGRAEIRIDDARFDVGAYRRFLASIAAETAAFRATQQDAFNAERRRWEEAGEFDAARRAEGTLAAVQTKGDAVVLPEGCERVDSMLGAQVIAIRVEPGAHVESGAELVVLSAMKAETSVVMPRSGTIVAVLCEVGHVVGPGTPLLVFQPD